MKTQKKAKPFSDEAIDKLLKQGQTAEDINGLLKQFTKAVLERAMQGELTHHLGYAKHDPSGNNSGNSRNSATRKTLKEQISARWNWRRRATATASSRRRSSRRTRRDGRASTIRFYRCTRAV